MQILKPSASRQAEQRSEQKVRSSVRKKQESAKRSQKLGKKNQRARGAVIQKPKEKKEASFLTLKKKLADLFSEIGRVSGFQSPIILALTVCVFVVGLAVFGLKGLKAEMPIERVTVQGDFYQIDKDALELTLAPLVGSNYVDVDIKAMKETLMNFAWVESVQVRKVWPASLEVTVIENRAIATWGSDGFVNEYGKVFKPDQVKREYLTGLPDLNGLDKQSDLVLSTYVDLVELARGSDLKIVQFSLHANSFWKLSFHQGSEVLLARERELQSFKTFLDAYNKGKLSIANQDIAKVDMRYSNGFSVEYSEKELSEKDKVKLGMTKVGAIQQMKKGFLKSTEKVGKHHG